MKITSCLLAMILLGVATPVNAKSHYVRNALIVGGVMMAAHHLTRHSEAYASQGRGEIQAEDRPLPNSDLTPGDALPVGPDDICVRGYSKKIRNVPISVKREVYAKYGVPYVSRQDEVDHLRSLELGGSNSIKNLWPQPYNQNSRGKRGSVQTPGTGNPDYDGYGAHQKDVLENKLHKLICQPGTPEQQMARMKQAQYEISHNWIDAYRKYVGKQPRPDTTNYGD